MDRLGFNIRLALWGLRRAPTFSIAVLLSLALGIGANSTMFAILDAVLLRSLPYPHSGELVSPSLGNTGIVPDSYFLAWAASTHTLSAIAEYNSGTATVIGAAAAEELPGAIASPDLVRVLDVTPALGRFITPEDGLAGAAPVVVLGYDAWQRQMSGDAHVLGRSIVIDGKQTTVVGVMPRGFAFPPHATFWQARPPIDVSPGAGFRVGMAVGRLRPGVSAMQVQRELALVPRPADLLRAKSLRDSAVSVPSTHDELYGSARPALVLLFAAVTLLLLIACANVANLVMARTTRRRHEFAVRAALGASRAALYWQVVGECLLLALGAGALGTLLAVWLSRVFTRLSPESIAQVDDVGVSGSVVLFTIGVSVLSAFLISSGPALRVARRGAHALIGDGGVRTGDGRFVHAMRRTLVVVQLSSAVVLLIGAGLLVKSLVRLNSQDDGFRAQHLLIVSVNLPSWRYPTRARAQQFFDALAARVTTLPGVVRAAKGPPPLAGYGQMYLHDATRGSESYRIAVSDVGPGFFETYGIPVLSGRSILASDDSANVPVVVVNKTAARLIAPTGDAIGQSLDAITINGQHPTIVGVVADIPQRDVAVRPLPEAFSASRQDPRWPSKLGVQVTGDPDALARPVQQAVRDLDRELVGRTVSMESMLSSSRAPHRFTAVLLGTFAGLAVVLAVVGLFGVISYLVEQRTREIGVRMALGAERRHVLGFVLREGLTLAAVGLTLGVVLALALGHLLQSLLYEVRSTDASVVLAAASTLCTISIVAVLIPARHAMQVDPVIALRAD